MEVDGDLKVTGTVESATIDSLKAVIADLQAQLVGMDGAGNKLETKMYTFTVIYHQSQSYPINFSEITNGELDNPEIAIIDLLDISNVTTFGTDRTYE